MSSTGSTRKRWYSVMLQYPDQEGSTYYTHVQACCPRDAVEVSRRSMLDDNDWTTEDYALDDIEVLLVLRGRHFGLSEDQTLP